MFDFSIESNVYDEVIRTYDFLKNRDNGYFPSVHDKEAFEMVSKSSLLSVDKIRIIFDKFSKKGASIYKEKTKNDSKTELLKKMTWIVSQNKEFPCRTNENDLVRVENETELVQHRYLNAIKLLADNLWCINPFMNSNDLEFVEKNIDNAKNIDNYFVDLIEKKNGQNLILIEKAFRKNTELNARNNELALECIDNIKNGKFTIAVSGLMTLCEGMVSSFILDEQDVRLIKPCKEQCEKALNNNQPMNYLKWLSIYELVNIVCKKSDFSASEPQINRHWLQHGRASKPNEKIDAIKLLNICFALLMIN